jgi:hypothetical protein
MCNDSRPRGRYTELREGLEKGSFRIRTNALTAVVGPVLFLNLSR